MFPIPPCLKYRNVRLQEMQNHDDARTSYLRVFCEFRSWLRQLTTLQDIRVQCTGAESVVTSFPECSYLQRQAATEGCSGLSLCRCCADFGTRQKLRIFPVHVTPCHPASDESSGLSTILAAVSLRDECCSLLCSHLGLCRSRPTPLALCVNLTET